LVGNGGFPGPEEVFAEQIQVEFLNPYAKKGARKFKLENGGGSEAETSRPKSRKILDVQK
jgi:hypothetical protein